MKVIPKVGFTATIDGIKYRAQEGVEIEMPKGADWVTAGLAVAAEKPKPAPKKSSKKKGS